ncbi:MAG: hydrogenase maturation protease [Desulfatitalea sp.]
MEKQTRGHSPQGAIVGVGNVLQRDDGIGVKILKYLEAAFAFPENVALIDGGTAGAGLQSSIMEKNWLLIIDALAVPGDPGEIRMISGRDILSRPSDLKLSPHQISFFDLIQLMELKGIGIEELTILGVVPENTRVGIDISPAVDASIEKAVACILSWLQAKEIVPEPVNGKITPDYWWQKPISKGDR